MTDSPGRLDLRTAAGHSWSMTIAGDAVVDRAGDQPIVEDGLSDRIQAADLAVVNFEAPVETDAAPLPKSGPSIAVPGSAPRALSRAGFDAATLANNHAMDYGPDGLDATLDACRGADLAPVGAGDDHDAALDPLVRTVGETEVALVNVCEHEFGIAADAEPGTAWLNHPAVDDVVSRAVADYDAVVVVAHGGIEEVPFPPPGRRDRFREFADLGVDAVVGHHPHVSQGWEVYDGVPLVYSLGNFYFEMPNPATRWGLTVDLEFAGGTLERLRVVPVELVDEVVAELDRECAAAHLAYLERLGEITADPDRLTPYWQAVAERVFLARHGEYLRDTTGASTRRLVTAPLDYLRGTGRWDPDARSDEMLVLLNLVRNESHRELLRTALEVRTGTTADRRTDSIRADANALLERTTDGSIDRTSTSAVDLARLAARKLRRDGRASLASVRRSLSPF